MKTWTWVFCLAIVGGAACSKQSSSDSRPPVAEKQERSLEQRINALDEYLAKGGVPEPAEVISPVLTKRGLEEFTSRLPQATVKESKLRFLGEVIAIFSVFYTRPGQSELREQEIQFIHGGNRWSLFWIPESGMKKKSETKLSTSHSAP